MTSAYKLELFKGYFIMLMKNNDLNVNFSFKLYMGVYYLLKAETVL